MPLLPLKLFGIVGGIVLVLVFFAPTYYLLLFDLLLIRYQSHWSFGGVRLDPSDLIIASLVASMLMRGTITSLPRIPYLLPWLILGIFLSLSYVSSPENSHNLTSPVRITYQVLRYCWKPVLYYPICVILLRGHDQRHMAVLAIVVAGDICALQAVMQGYSGVNIVGGPFGYGNELASVLIVPFVIALSGTLFPYSRMHWIFSGLSLGLLARALLFSASRGGMASAVAGAVVVVAVAFLLPTGRRYVLRMIPIVCLALVLLLIVRPDVFDRPAVRHAASVVDGRRAETMQWRMTERWPHFLAIALEHPILGTGSAVDESLGEGANTPHNGLLTIAVTNGFVVLFLILLFFFRLVLDSMKLLRSSEEFHERIFLITMAAALMGVMIHNVIDATLNKPAVLKFFWLLCALGATRARLPRPLGAGANLPSRVAERSAASPAPS